VTGKRTVTSSQLLERLPLASPHAHSRAPKYVAREAARCPIFMNELFGWIESTGLARAVAGSAVLTASLSAFHVIGFTLVTSGALVANLRTLGALFRTRPMAEVIRPTNRAILAGLAISVSTGGLLFAARANEVSSNGTFQLKMLLLAAAASFHFTVHRRLAAAHAPVGGALGLSLWLGLAVTACAFILLE
jgi:hypothetical protein